MTGTLSIGDKIRHLKRGSTYRVLAFAEGDPTQLSDNAPACLALYEGSGIAFARVALEGQGLDLGGISLLLRLPLTVQVSGDDLASSARMVIYQGLSDGLVWARPLAEFTPDRFLSLDPDVV